ncbi:MAG TPA: ABC transporter ATP-binding protein [Methanospirillum sp.]|nr:ABC transporter ATP-binding protein [Methanospirillum sp.]
MEEIPVIEFALVTKIYPLKSGNVTALDKVSLRVMPGEFIAIMGPSGSGKSTLLNMMGCLDVPTQGDVFIRGTSIKVLSDNQLTDLRLNEIGFIFQQFNLIQVLSALENVRYPLILKNGLIASIKQCQDTLASVGLTKSFWDHRPNELSGGQQQRVAIARSLINNPSTLLCDEPTGNLDSKTGVAIMDLLSHLCKEEGKTIIMVTHDPKIAEYADRIITIEDGRVGVNT